MNKPDIVKDKKTSISPKARKRPGGISKKISQNCRCKCSSVCSIEGPDSIKAGRKKAYTLEVRTTRNLGCKAGTGNCTHKETEWKIGGMRAANVTLSDETKMNVKVKVAARTAAGTFTLQAQPKTTCECKGPDDIVRDCKVQNERVTIKVT